MNYIIEITYPNKEIRYFKDFCSDGDFTTVGNYLEAKVFDGDNAEMEVWQVINILNCKEDYTKMHYPELARSYKYVEVGENDWQYGLI